MELDKINTRDYMLTLWLKDINQLDFYNFIESKIEKIVFYVVGATEKTELENEHFHAYIKFKNPIRATTLKKMLPSSTHIEKMKTTMEKCYNYCIEEGLVYTNINPSDLKHITEREDSFSLCVQDIFINNLSIKEICLKYGKIAILHLGNIEKLYQIKEKDEIREFEYRLMDDVFNSSI